MTARRAAVIAGFVVAVSGFVAAVVFFLLGIWTHMSEWPLTGVVTLTVSLIAFMTSGIYADERGRRR